MEEYLNEKQVSARYGWGLSTLRNWRFLSRGPCYSKIGKSIRYKISDLEMFMSAGRIDPASRREAV